MESSSPNRQCSSIPTLPPEIMLPRNGLFYEWSDKTEKLVHFLTERKVRVLTIEGDCGD
jgi:hypothetical protein